MTTKAPLRQPISNTLRIERTACNFGGTRPWLCCPRCRGRVAVLFLRGSQFICRACGRVAYASQSEDSLGRTWRRQRKLEARLGAHWQRPKGMHHATRTRIVEAIHGCEMVRDDALADFMARSGFVW